MKIVSAEQASGLSVAIAGAPGAGKTHVGAQTRGQVWLLTESNGLGTIREGKDKLAFAEKPSDLLEKLDESIPLVIPIYKGSPKEKTKILLAMCKFIKEKAVEIKAAGRSTVIFDSLSDYNSFLVEGETPEDGSKIDFDAWQRIKVNTERPIEALKHITNAGLDFITIFGLKATDAAMGGSIINGGYRPLIQGGARDTFLFKFMSCCTINSVAKKTKEGIAVERTAAFIGKKGDLFKPKGDLQIESTVDFYEWKAKAFPDGETK